MIIFPNCKINIGLNIIDKRSDGFHNIETVFYPVPWCDALEIVKIDEPESAVEIKTTGLRVYGQKENNLCIRAYLMLAEKYKLPAVRIHLHKIIPVGAGLGGGSSDAASSIILLDKLFKLNMEDDEMEKTASLLGSDCPFFIRNKPVFAGGKGDRFEPISLKLKNYFLVIVKPRAHISTTDAYASVKPSRKKHSLKELIQLPVEDWKDKITNDFETTIFEKIPGIRNIKNKLYKFGAVYASMSGSGSSVYGLFKEEKNLSAYFRSCTLWQGKL